MPNVKKVREEKREHIRCAQRFSTVVLKIRYWRINNVELSELVRASVFTLNWLCIGLHYARAICTAWVVIRDVRNVNALALAMHMY